MGEILFWLITLSSTAAMAFSLGVRRERGRQMRIEDIRSAERVGRATSGVRLRRMKIRR